MPIFTDNNVLKYTHMEKLFRRIDEIKTTTRYFHAEITKQSPHNQNEARC